MVDCRFAFLVIVGVAREGHMIAGDPFFQDIRSITERLSIAIPGGEPLRCVAVVLWIDVEILTTELGLVCLWIDLYGRYYGLPMAAPGDTGTLQGA